MGRGAETKVGILDVAEEKFAEHGYDGVSMRVIAAAAKVPLGLITYHFSTKENLFEALIARRADTLNRLRQDKLAALIDPTLEDVLDAFLCPYRDLIVSGGPGWIAYSRLIAIIAQESRWTPLVSRHFSALGHQVITLLMTVEAGLDRDSAVRAYVQIVATMIGEFASTGLLDRFSEGRLASTDIASNYEPMIRFLSGGIRALSQMRHVER